jgi:hypothetical protein
MHYFSNVSKTLTMYKYGDRKNIIFLLLFLFLFFISNNMDLDNISNIQTNNISAQADPWVQVGLDNAWVIIRYFYMCLTEILYVVLNVCMSVFSFHQEEFYLGVLKVSRGS